MFKTKSNLLKFDKLDKIGNMFPKECVVKIPDFVPVTYPNHTQSIGMVVSHSRDTSRIEIETYINHCDEKTIEECIKNGNLYSGGYYKINESHMENGIRVIDDITLKSVGLYFDDVFGDDDLKMEVIE